jgi:hypothetical protein
MKVTKKPETASFNILPTKTGRGWFFFPSLPEGKNHPLPIRGDCLIRQLGLYVREDLIYDYDNEPMPWSDHCKLADWRDFCLRMVRTARSKNRAKRVLVNDSFKNGVFIHC